MSTGEMDIKASRLNPVLEREIRERMRSGRSVVILMFTLGLLSGVLYLSYYGGNVMLRQQGFFAGGFTTASIGRMMFEWLVLVELVLIMFTAPGISAGAIVGEKERRTLHLLQLTLLRPRSIATGKLSASVLFLLLLVVGSAPLFTLPMVIGGVHPWQVLKALIVLCAFTVCLSSLGLYLSAIARRIQFSVVGAYLLTFVFVVGSWVLFGVETFGRETGVIPLGGLPMSAYANPMLAVSDAVSEPGLDTFAPSPLTGMGSMLEAMRNRSLSGIGVDEPADNIIALEDEGFRVPLWLVFTVLCAVLSALLVSLTSLRLKLPRPALVIGRGR